MPDPINWQLALPYLLTALAFGYFLGSIPFGLIITKFAGLGDIRKIGSGNIGTTNVLRTGHKGLAILTLLCDGFKGTLAVCLAGMFGPDQAVVAGLGAFIGHLFPVWLRFKGGKGIATYLGVMLGLSLIGFATFAVTWVVTAVIFRWSSFAALVACLVTPLTLYLCGYIQIAELTLVMSALACFAHRKNIARLLSGQEPKIGQKS